MAAAPNSPRLQVAGGSPGGDQETVGWGWGVAVGTPYSPHMLDGWLGPGKHKTMLTFRSYMVSYDNISNNKCNVTYQALLVLDGSICLLRIFLRIQFVALLDIFSEVPSLALVYPSRFEPLRLRARTQRVIQVR